MNAFAPDGQEPELTHQLARDPAAGAARKAAIGTGPDRIERAGDAFHTRVAEAYRLLAESDSRIVRLDASGTRGAVHEAIVAVLADGFPETFAGAPGL
ncbi:MAG: hypothetical protein P8177_10125 [Gemmatimonadota bacterium]